MQTVPIGTVQTGNNINLLVFSPEQTESEVQHKTIKMLYWAAIRGRNEIVEKCIRMGYSPFLKSYKAQNALMAAIQSKNIEIVKLIVSFDYSCEDMDFLTKSRQCKDFQANNAMHYAYKTVSALP